MSTIVAAGQATQRAAMIQPGRGHPPPCALHLQTAQPLHDHLADARRVESVRDARRSPPAGSNAGRCAGPTGHRPAEGRIDVTLTTRSAAPAPTIPTVSLDDVPANRRRGGDVRTILSPATVGATSGFLGTATLAPGDVITEHWHPYSEEFLFCVRGPVTLWLNGERRTLTANQGVLVPTGIRHRLANPGTEIAFLVFQLSPLAPRPELGHVDTEAPSGGVAP
jgi:putative monooxygenase